MQRRVDCKFVSIIECLWKHSIALIFSSALRVDSRTPRSLNFRPSATSTASSASSFIIVVGKLKLLVPQTLGADVNNLDKVSRGCPSRSVPNRIRSGSRECQPCRAKKFRPGKETKTGGRESEPAQKNQRWEGPARGVLGLKPMGSLSCVKLRLQYHNIPRRKGKAFPPKSVILGDGCNRGFNVHVGFRLLSRRHPRTPPSSNARPFPR